MRSPSLDSDSVPVAGSTPPLGRYYDVGGKRLMLHRLGDGAPAVVFLPGAGMVGLDFLNVHERTAERSTSVVYDRGGTGWSEHVELPRSPGDVTDELRALLRVAGILAPYLLVGHSLGGAYARHFAQRFPSEVSALLLVDPAHEDLSAHWPREVLEAQEQMKSQPMPEPPPELFAAFRVLFEQKFAEWPGQVRERLIDYHLERWRIGLLEASNADDVVYPQLQRSGSIPDVPMIVLTAMGIDAGHTMGMSEDVQRRVNEGKRIVNVRLAERSPQGEHRELPDAVHAWVHFDRPDAVLQAIGDLLERARAEQGVVARPTG
jgi:pimeloyl-ACP methyl ester carboxylesterase